MRTLGPLPESRSDHSPRQRRWWRCRPNAEHAVSRAAAAAHAPRHVVDRHVVAPSGGEHRRIEVAPLAPAGEAGCDQLMLTGIGLSEREAGATAREPEHARKPGPVEVFEGVAAQ